jgi:hypothetical protein
LENEARSIWQKHHKNPRPTNKGWICRVFYMRIKALYKQSGRKIREKENKGNTKRTDAKEPTA